MTDGPRTHLSTGSTTKRAASLSGWGTAWVLGIGLILAVASPAYAMHIAEQILPAPWAGLWFLVALPAVYWGLRQIRRRAERDPRYNALVGLVGSAVFLISCMPILGRHLGYDTLLVDLVEKRVLESACFSDIRDVQAVPGGGL